MGLNPVGDAAVSVSFALQHRDEVCKESIASTLQFIRQCYVWFVHAADERQHSSRQTGSAKRQHPGSFLPTLCL